MNIDEAIRDSIPSEQTNGQTSSNGTHSAPSWKRWTDLSSDGQTLHVPAIDFTSSSLSEDRSSYDITVKLFHLRPGSTSSRETATRSALQLVLKELHMPSVDLLIVSFPGIYFDLETEDCPTKIKSRGSVPTVDPEPLDSLLSAWQGCENLHDEGLVKQLGVAEFGPERLEPFISRTRVPPTVDQINLRDCCSVPRPLLDLAKSSGVQLLVHNDCSNILPQGTVRDLLGQGEGGAGVLAGGEGTDGLKGEVLPQWVVKYTAVVRDRGVVENKGYFALAEVV